MKELPTAEEFLSNHHTQNPIEMLKEFAKLHVEAALKAAYENSEVRITENALIDKGSCYTSYDDGVITALCDKDSILNAYNLDNIK